MMIIKVSVVSRNDYIPVSNIKRTNIKNIEGDLVLKRIDDFEKREQILQLRKKVMQAEQERIDGVVSLSVFQARKQLRERAN